MSWQYLFFDSDSLQRSDIESLKTTAQFASASVDDALTEIGEAKKKIARLELTVEALVRLLETKLSIDREELALMIQRIDLSDGVEDARIGPDRAQAAPKCSHCARPFNEKRVVCIYCGHEVKKQEVAPPPPRTIACRGCQSTIEEASAFITMKGLLCNQCYADL
jgi:hypothetical protein